jgi:hypothetical protein
MKSLLSFLVGTLLLGTTPVLGAIWVVDDPGDPLPVAGGTTTLRQAITAAELNPGPDTILFQILPGGPQTIMLTSPLPVIMQNGLTIDGYSQPGASPGGQPPFTSAIMIQVDGMLAGAAHGLWIMSSFNTVQGLAIMNFAQDGIRVQGTSSHVHGNLIWGNFVGTDASGTVAAANGTSYVPGGPIWAGIDVLTPPSAAALFCHNNTVRQNLVSANVKIGISISSCPPSDCYGNTVSENIVGVDITGMFPMGNGGTGIVLAEGTHHNQIVANLVSANGENGIDLTGLPLSPYTLAPVYTHDNHLIDNVIGLAVDRSTPLGNGGYGISFGIYERHSPWGFVIDNHAELNTVAHNGFDGFCVWENPVDNTNCDRNRISKNSTFSNIRLGIDLGADGVTFNDPGDMDIGANQQENFPMIMMAIWVPAPTWALAVNGIASPGSEVELFRADVDPSMHGEGAAYLGTTYADALGNWSLSVPFQTAVAVTATSTNSILGPNTGDTSEFSPVFMVEGSAGVDFADAPDPVYPTLLASNGARHTIWPGLQLGFGPVDSEADGQPEWAARGDDFAATDDEDGIQFLTPVTPGQTARIVVMSMGSGRLDAWIDFMSDGSWAEAGDQVFASYPLSATGIDTLSFNVPPAALPGQYSFARFRYGYAGGLSFAGPADDGEVEDYRVFIGTTTAVRDRSASAGIVLEQNVPNPFNPLTTIAFDLPVAGRATLSIYSVDGRRVAVLVDEHLDAGPHTRTWNGTDAGGEHVASGVYFCRLRSLGQQRVIRMTLLR